MGEPREVPWLGAQVNGGGLRDSVEGLGNFFPVVEATTTALMCSTAGHQGMNHLLDPGIATSPKFQLYEQDVEKLRTLRPSRTASAVEMCSVVLHRARTARQAVGTQAGVYLNDIGLRGPTVRGADPAHRQQERWVRAVIAMTAAHSVVAGLAATERDWLLPAVQQTLFLLLAAPFRGSSNGTVSGPWRQAVGRAYGGDPGGDIAQDAGVARLVAAGEEARQGWLVLLSHHQSYPLLARLTAENIEEQLEWVVLADPWSADPQPLSIGVQSGPTAATWACGVRVVEQFLLPHFALGRVRRVVKAFKRAPRTADLTAAAFSRRLRTSRLQLRWAATSAVGFVALASLGGAWWTAGWWQCLVGTVILVVPTFLYLWGQLGAYGVDRMRGLGRASRELLVGTRWAVPVVVGGVILMGVGLRDGFDLFGAISNSRSPVFLFRQDVWWRLGRHALRLVLAVSWCVTSGVFLQALWQSEAISTPLAHHRWERRP